MDPQAQAPDHRRATAERNIQAILDAAEELLERGGQPSISAVAAQAGVSRVTVYAHFPTPQALLEAVVQRSAGRAAAVLDSVHPERGPASEALDRLLAAGWRELHRNGAIAAAAATQLSPAALTRSHQAAQQRLRDLVDRGQADGSFRADLPAGWLVTSCFALIHACADEVRAGRLDPAAAHGVLAVTIRDLLLRPAAGRA
ncbi:MAG TPA: helix-turn-helix domain-containing protein [Streptosporangiaceae bacterium]|nr:helix-turn-helix domain-containing protein [Streptosporangiaceae bacterium]